MHHSRVTQPDPETSESGFAAWLNPWLRSRRGWVFLAIGAVAIGVGVTVLLLIVAADLGAPPHFGQKWILLPAGFGIATAVETARRHRRIFYPQDAGQGRFRAVSRGYDPDAVDRFWADVDLRTDEELEDATFPVAMPGYDIEHVDAALRARAEQRRASN